MDGRHLTFKLEGEKPKLFVLSLFKKMVGKDQGTTAWGQSLTLRTSSINFQGGAGTTTTPKTQDAEF